MDRRHRLGRCGDAQRQYGADAGSGGSPLSASNPAALLVLGFGAFADVVDNPSARLARAIDGQHLGTTRRIVGLEMPCSYARCVEVTREAVAACAPVAVIGIGVARRREVALVERVGRNAANPDLLDNDGVGRAVHGDGPAERRCGWSESLAAALGIGVSDDAGAYVCNAWLYAALGDATPAAFVHIPPEGFDPEAFVAGLRRYFDAADTRTLTGA